MAKSKAMCCGCCDDFYNHREGMEGCWLFKNATVVSRVAVGTWQPPPYPRRPQKVLSCYHCIGTHYLELTDCRIAKTGKEKVK